MDSDIKRIHAFTMIAKYNHGIGGTNDSLDVVMSKEDPSAHMSIRIGTANYYRSEYVLAALDDLFTKALLDSFTSSDKLLSTILKDSGVLDAYAEFKNIK